LQEFWRAHPVVVALFCAVACSSPLAEQEDDLSRAQSRWHAAAIQDYSFEFQRGCFCIPTATRAVIVTVRQATVANLTYVDDGTPADTSLFRDFLTVDRYFAFIRQTVDQQPASLAATYDGAIGYPNSVDVDFRTGVADDEFSFRMSRFRVLP